MGSSEHTNPASTPGARRGLPANGRMSDVLGRVLLFATTINLLSLPLAGGLAVTIGPWTVGSPSFAVSAAAWVIVAAWHFRRSWADRTAISKFKDWAPGHAHVLAVAGLTLVGLLLRVASIDFGMPLLVHIDEQSVVGVAIEQLRSGWLDPEWYVYPTFFMNLMLPALAVYFIRARGQGIVGPIDQVPSTTPGFYLVGRYHAALLGTATIVFTYALGQRLLEGRRGRDAGLIGAGIVAFSFIHVRESHFAVTDVPAAAVATAALLAIAGVLHRGAPRDYVSAGFLCGLAASTKYTAAPVVLSFAAAHLAGRSAGDWHRKPLWLGLAAIPAGFLLGSPYALLNWKPFLEHLGWLSGFAGNPAAAEVRANFLYIVGYSAESGFSLPVFVLLVIAIGRAIYARRPAELVLVAFVLGSIPQMTQTTHNFYPRFLVPLVPAVAVLVGGLVVDCLDGLRARGALSPRVATACLGLAIVVLPAGTIGESLRWVVVQGRQDTRAAAYEWIGGQFPQGVVIASEVDIIGAPSRYRVLDVERPLDAYTIEDLAREDVGIVILDANYDAVSGDRQAARSSFRRQLGAATRFSGAETGAPGPTIDVHVIRREDED